MPLPVVDDETDCYQREVVASISSAVSALCARVSSRKQKSRRKGEVIIMFLL